MKNDYSLIMPICTKCKDKIRCDYYKKASLSKTTVCSKFNKWSLTADERFEKKISVINKKIEWESCVMTSASERLKFLIDKKIKLINS